MEKKKNRMFEIIEGINGQLSSKRTLGVLGAVVCIFLLVYFVIETTRKGEYAIASSLITTSLAFFIGLVAGGSLGEQYFGKKNPPANGLQNEQPTQ